MTRFTSLLLILLLAANASGQGVFLGVGDTAPATIQSGFPVFDQFVSQRIASDGSIDISQTVLQGTGLTWSIANAPPNVTINSSTGQVTGTPGTAGSWMAQVSATNSLGTYYGYLPINARSGSVVTMDAAWFASEGSAPYYLDIANTTYILDQNLTVDRTAFVVKANGVTLDLGGFTVTYNNEAPITIANFSFETEDAVDSTHAEDWDFTNAPNAERVAGTWLSSQMFDGSYSVVFDAGEDEYITHEDTITLAANTRYVLAFHVFWANETQPANTTFYATLTDGEDTYTASRTTGQNRGMQLVEFEFVTDADPGSFTLTVGVDGTAEAALISPTVHFDRIKVAITEQPGVLVEVSSAWADFGTAAAADYCIVRNGTITQGQANGSWCPAVVCYSDAGTTVENISATVSGDNCYGVMFLAGVHSDNLNNCTVNGNPDAAITSRDNDHGSLIYFPSGSIHANTLEDGPHNGLRLSSNSGAPPTVACNNTITLPQDGVYTNSFCLMNRLPVQGCVLHDNNLTGVRGIYDGYICFDNTIAVAGSNRSQEYSTTGIQNGSAYGHQIEHTDFPVTVWNETITLTGAYGGHCFRVTGVPDNEITVSDMTLTVDVSANPNGGNAEHVPTILSFAGSPGTLITFEDIVATTNCGFANYTGSAIDHVYKRFTYTYIDDGISNDYSKYVSTSANLNMVREDWTYGDAGSYTHMEGATRAIIGYAEDTTQMSETERNNVTLAITSGGNPVASTAATVVDAQAGSVFDSTTNGSGQAGFLITDYTRINGSRTEYQPATVDATGYQSNTINLDWEDNDENTPPSISLTAD